MEIGFRVAIDETTKSSTMQLIIVFRCNTLFKILRFYSIKLNISRDKLFDFFFLSQFVLWK